MRVDRSPEGRFRAVLRSDTAIPTAVVQTARAGARWLGVADAVQLHAHVISGYTRTISMLGGFIPNSRMSNTSSPVSATPSSCTAMCIACSNVRVLP